MADDDEPSPGFGDEPWSPPGPRRSTYTPPVEHEQFDDDAAGAWDDDELANALASQLPPRQPTGTIPLITASELSGLPAPSGPPVVFPETADIPTTSGLPNPPKRRSLDDADLERSIDEAVGEPGMTSSALDRFEAELKLRQSEARQFSDWQKTMLSIGTPEALSSLEAALPTFTGVIDIVQPQPTVAAEPEPDSQPDPEPGPDPEAARAPEQAPGPQAAPVLYELVEPVVAAAPALTAESLNFAPPTTSPPLNYDELPPPPAAADPVFIEPVGVLDPELGQLHTGSRAIIQPTVEAEPDDDVDDTDRAFADSLGAIPVTSQGETILPAMTGSAPIQPMASPRVPVSEVVLDSDLPTALPATAIESAGQEPTPLERRVGRAARMFWLWFATNSSVLSIAFGAALFSLGMSLRQAVVATFIGVAISFLPLGLGTLAGKWSGQPTMVASRATFGVTGNVVPAVLAVVTRVFWGAVLLWLVAISTAHILVGARLSGSLTEFQLTVVTMAVGFLIALAVAVFGYGLFARIQLILAVVSAVLVVGLVAITWQNVHIGRALTIGDGPWMLVVTGVVLVFSFVGLIWMSSSGDLARYQRPSSSGAAAMLWAPFGATLPAFLLIAYGALLAASNPDVAHGLTTNPLDTIARMIPVWYPVPLIAATVLSLLAGVVLSIYSGGFALQAVGVRVHRAWSTTVIGVLVFAVAVILSFTVVSVVPVFRDLATTLAVPVAAWAGIFTADMIIRRRRFDSASLLRRGGVYPTVNWVTLSMLVVISAVGYGLTTATIGWLEWQGYLFRAFGVRLTSDLAGTDIGVIVALVLALLVTFATQVPTVRKQELDRAIQI